MADMNPDSPPLEDVLYMLNHVFLPPKLPQENDSEVKHDIALCALTHRASLEFTSLLSEPQRQQWSFVSNMLEMLIRTTRNLDQHVLQQNILDLGEGGFLALRIRAQNAALIMRRRPDCMIFESFEVQPLPEAVMQAEGKLLCSYPGPAVELPLEIARDPSFVEQLASFLVHMDVDELPGAQATTVKAGSEVPETRSTANPRYITQLLSMILLGMGKEAQVNRITKRIADEVCWKNARDPWRRSPLWLVIRVAIQTSVGSCLTYKRFMIFLQIKLLRLFLGFDLPSELLYVTRIKTSRRIYKLGQDAASPPLLDSMKALCEEIEERLQSRWSAEQQQQAESPSYTPVPSDFEKHTILSLSASRTYLEEVLHRESHNNTSTEFIPSHHRRIRDTFDFHELYPDALTNAVKEDRYLALADFEWLVQERLDDWVTANNFHEFACRTLDSCLEQYTAATKAHYLSSPEDESLMLLTIMELWVALDVSSIVQCPLLASYSPEVPPSFLNPLLLRRAKSFERAARIQVYLRRRHSSITCTTSIYSNQFSEATFSVRYFKQSSELKATKNSIEQEANRSRDNKRAELRMTNTTHAELIKEIGTLDCMYLPLVGHQHWKCDKCKLQKKADRLRINVHEWPLPERPLEAEAIIFELNCPPVFVNWRRWTYHILRDIGMSRVGVESEFTPNEYLETYVPLKKWLKNSSTGRITFASEAKSFLKAHYHEVRWFPAREDQVFVNNGLRFQLYDTAKCELVHWAFDIDLEPYCTSRLHSELYQGLQYAVAHTTHAHNATIVNQGDCPSKLSIHEQLAFSNLRCGSRLQWMNIARELRTNVLTLSREEVHTLIMQAAWQIGPLAHDGSTREWHVELDIPEFGHAFIREGKYILSHVETNWMEGTTVKSIIYLSSRLLSSAQDRLVQDAVYTLLREARVVTHKWMREIVNKLQGAIDDSQANELQRRACEMAAICRATFDVDPRNLASLLCSENDVAILIESSIVVHDNTPPHLGDTFPDFQKLLHRDRRLSYVLEERLEILFHDPLFKRGMDTAIKSVWPGYRSGVEWQQLAKQNSRWLTSSTAPLASQQAQKIHYNMLDGTLLVDGRQLGRLTREIIEHPTYQRIFGQKILDVIPADMPGMDYATRSAVCDYKVFFALRGTKLVIRVKTPANGELELIPNHVLREDFPSLFSTEYVHWMDVNSGVIEFRPLDQLWEESKQNLRLEFSKTGPSRLLLDESGKCLLIDIRTSTFRGMAARLLPLERSEHLTIAYHSEVLPGTISIDLPRLRLSFFLSNGEIESKNMQGMIIDSDQCTGTMIGLRNQLVLRHKNHISASLPRSRSVIIPVGDVHFSLSPDGNHVRVHIDTRTDQVQWYRYEIDNDLGLLVSNAGLTGRLYRIYLHALCGHPLSDPLTRQRGTDHALQELSAAASFSFQRVTDADLKLLRLISKITPSRLYYPRHLKSMQTTEWSPNLPGTSQHGAFDRTVRRILSYVQSLSIFSNLEMDLNAGYDCPSSLLAARAIQRNGVYYEGCIESSADVKYPSHNSLKITPYDSHGLEALKTSRLVYAWPGGLTRHLRSSELLDIFKEWSHMSGPTHHISLSYTKEWLGLDLPANWLGIYNLCHQGSAKKFHLVFSFAALAYSIPEAQRFITLLLAFATTPRSCFIPPPPHLLYNLEDGFEPLRDKVQRMITSGCIDIMDSPSGQLVKSENEKSKDFHRRRLNHYSDITEPKINHAVGNLLNQWCCYAPQSPFRATDDPEWFEIEKIMCKVEEYFTSCSHNKDLLSFTSQITAILQSNYVEIQVPVVEVSEFCFIQEIDILNDRFDSTPTLESLLQSRSTPVPLAGPSNGAEEPAKFQGLGAPLETLNVAKLISQFTQNCGSIFARVYSERLENSRRQLDGRQTVLLPQNVPPISICIEYRDQCQRHLNNIFSLFRSALSPSSTIEEILELSGLWPSIYPRALLCCLASTSQIRPRVEWIERLINLAGLFISYQYSQRLLSFSHRREVDNFYKELQNASFNWSDARENPDWLLIQIQGNFITRAVQSEIAREMIAPPSGQNTVLQLNMGEGKSHVIVPLVTVALADSKKLVRVVVSKPLAGQMFHLLAERISGLTNRRVFYLPFSRDVKMDTKHIGRIRELFEDCARVQGVLVTQPEHILSFRLMVVDRLLASASPLEQSVQELNNIQAWLTSVSRDVLDESDELLHVRYQLIYTMGEQQPLDGGPDRWTLTQQVFDLVRHHMRQIHAVGPFPRDVEILDSDASEGAFPLVRLLGKTPSSELISKIAEDVVDGKLNCLTVVGLSPGSYLREAVLAFLKERSVSDEKYQIVKHTYDDSGHWKGLLLLRGLLAHGILTYVLSRQRWRVDYGLDSGRSLLAVPYRAKDIPSLRSEFGHPDVAICLTCLSYYYGGLTFAQVQECFDLLAKLDNPALEYQNWVRRGGNDIPESLRLLMGVNIKDIETFTNVVVPRFKHNQATIDFFLSLVVFPKEAKEFTAKLGTSGWDLAEKRANVTTGFSGTNDNSDLLPTSITPANTANTARQLATNAQVLDYLLRPENKRYICTKNDNGQPSSVTEFLKLLIQEAPEIRVLLDVGAQMLEMTNQQLVTHWLKLAKEEIAAGVFFDDADQLTVISRDGVVEQLYSSPFYQRLHECIIYLDDAHTRGTDLKLPLHYRAAVTLGPKVTKDRLVQGCMRMRKLGHGQSVIFCAPPEVDKRIRETQRVAASEKIEVMDMLCWVMSRTCDDIEDHVPHWIQQGVDYHQRQTLDLTLSASTDEVLRLKDVWLQPAARSLDDMYGSVDNAHSPLNAVSDFPDMRDRLDELGVTVVHDARMEEEQEREVSHELEQERQVERPPKIKPALHRLDEEVSLFIRYGIIPTTGKPGVLFPLMTPFSSSSQKLTPQNPWSEDLLCTRDFMTTTDDGGEKSMLTSYLRPVQWILSHTRGDGRMILVVMSPYEVDRLLQDIRTSKHVRLHMYAPRTTQAMKPLDDLVFYCIPPLPQGNSPWMPPSLDVRCQLNIWGGQLYLDKYDTYLRLCLLLGISCSEKEGYTSVESDRFVPESGRIGDMKQICLFDKSPIALLKTLFGLRRKGMSFDMTHMGKILSARLLSPEDFEERRC